MTTQYPIRPAFHITASGLLVLPDGCFEAIVLDGNPITMLTFASLYRTSNPLPEGFALRLWFQTSMTVFGVVVPAGMAVTFEVNGNQWQVIGFS